MSTCVNIGLCQWDFLVDSELLKVFAQVLHGAVLFLFSMVSSRECIESQIIDTMAGGVVTTSRAQFNTLIAY